MKDNFLTAIKSNDLQTLRSLLLQANSDISGIRYNGNTLLHLAAGLGNKGAVQMLILLGNANVHATNNKMETPLHFAVEYYGIAALLMGRGADPCATNIHNRTPMSLASTTVKELMLIYKDMDMNSDISFSNQASSQVRRNFLQTNPCR